MQESSGLDVVRRTLSRFSRVLLDPETEDLLSPEHGTDFVTVAFSLPPHDGRANANAILKHARRTVRAGRILAVTRCPLIASGVGDVFGYADTKLDAAIVSWARFAHGSRTEVLMRLANTVVHEDGHLLGLGHCERASCVMRAVSTVADLNLRPMTFCGSCPELRPLGLRIRGLFGWGKPRVVMD